MRKLTDLFGIDISLLWLRNWLFGAAYFETRAHIRNQNQNFRLVKLPAYIVPVGWLQVNFFGF